MLATAVPGTESLPALVSLEWSPFLPVSVRIDSITRTITLTRHLLPADFIVVITSRTPSCRLLSHPIYLANDFRLLPVSNQTSSQAILDNPVERELVSLVEQGLRAGRLWFSYGLDLTNTSQRQQDLVEAGRDREPMWRKADDRFFWNKHLMAKMIERTELGGKQNDVSTARDNGRMGLSTELVLSRYS